MVITPHEELYRMQRKLYLRNKEIIDHSILVKEPDFDRYEKRYQRKVAGFEKISSDAELMRAVMKADIIYVGDYHTCNQSQRSFLRILRAIIKKTDNFMIGLELIHEANQPILDKFMKGHFKESLFLKRVGFHQQWIFDLWDNFKPIFDFAKYHKIPVKALDAAKLDAPLKDRDETTGKLIAKYMIENPGRKMFVFIGDLHLAPEHLPKEVEGALKGYPSAAVPKCPGRTVLRKSKQRHRDTEAPRRSKSLILYQNSEAIYWKLAREGIEDQVSVVKIDDGAYCRMHTPPVVAQQSYLNWLEHEEGEIDYADAKHSFLELADRISKFLDLKIGKEKDNVEVYTSGDLSFLKHLRRKKDFSKKDFNTIKRQILSSESYYLAKERVVYLANLSVNHAAEEAAHFIKSICSGPEFPRDLIDAFYANILHEALGFFGSKLINSKRKCLHEKGFKDLFAYFQTVRVPRDRKLEYETAHLVTEYVKYERRGKSLHYTTIFEQGADLFMSVTHALGYMLGDKMYYAMKLGVLKRLSIRYMFYDKWDGEGAPFEAYSAIREQVKGVKIPKRM